MATCTGATVAADGGGGGVGDGSNVNVALTEEDIPGACLSEPYELHTNTELRWWLLCRGISAPSSWKKAQLVER